MMADQVYIFTHIPKTAGTSIRKHFSQYLDDHIEFIHLAKRGQNRAEQNGFVNFYQKPRVDRNKAKVILGHQVNKRTKELLDKKPVEVVIFRDPVSWEISRFNQYANRLFKMTGKLISLNEWFYATNKLHSQFDWFICNYLNEDHSKFINNNDLKLDLLTRELNNFDYVLFIDKIEETLKPIYKDLKIPDQMSSAFNKVGLDKKNFFERSPENINSVNKECLEEIKIYNKLYEIYN